MSEDKACRTERERERFEYAVGARKFDFLYHLPLQGSHMLARHGDGYAHQVLDALWRLWKEVRVEPVFEAAKPAVPGPLAEIQRLLRTMLASATTLGGEWIEGYQIKTGALHQILGVMQEAGFPVSIPLPQPPSEVLAELQKAMRDEVIPGIVQTMRDRADAGAAIANLPLSAAPPLPVAQGVPEGYALVPVEPTGDMQAAGAQAIRFDTTVLNKLWTGNAVFRAMVAAAPTPPAAPPEPT